MTFATRLALCLAGCAAAGCATGRVDGEATETDAWAAAPPPEADAGGKGADAGVRADALASLDGSASLRDSAADRRLDAVPDGSPITSDAGVSSLLFQDDFSSGSGKWLCTQGTWTTGAGTFDGREIAAQTHAAACLTRRAPTMDRVVVQFNFRFEGRSVAAGFHYWGAPQNHHLIHVDILNTGTVTVYTQRGWGGQPIKSWRSSVGSKSIALTPTAWNRARIQVYDDLVRVWINDVFVVQGKVDPMPVTTPTPRNGLGLSATGVGALAQFDDVQIWQAAP